MELTLKKRSMELYEHVLDSTMALEETLDIIVPDLSPDILRIVSATGAAYVKEKNPREGKLDASGVIKGFVLYVAEGDKVVRRLEFTMPFAHVFEAAGLTSASKVMVCARIRGMDAREINPRKINVRAVAEISAKAFESREVHICEDIENAGEYGIETRKTKISLYSPQAVCNKSFTISDDVEIPSSRPPFASMLKYDIALRESDMKLIGNKAIIKGAAQIKYVYNTRDGSMATCEHELPFSQIVDIEGVTDDCELRVNFCIRGAEIEPQHDMAGDARYITVSILVDVCAIAYFKGDVSMLGDMYSTRYNLDIKCDTMKFTELTDRFSKRVAVTETMETGSAIKQVVDISVRLEPHTIRCEEGGEVIVNEANISVLYSGEDDTAYCATRKCSVVCPVNIEGENEFICDVTTAGESYTAGMGNELIIRFFADYDITAVRTESVTCVGAVQADEQNVKDVSNNPSVIIKYIEATRPIWEIAKQYNTTVAEIISANGLGESESVSEGSLILIPRKR